jgi:hypothetical protein
VPRIVQVRCRRCVQTAWPARQPISGLATSGRERESRVTRNLGGQPALPPGSARWSRAGLHPGGSFHLSHARQGVVPTFSPMPATPAAVRCVMDPSPSRTRTPASGSRDSSSNRSLCRVVSRRRRSITISELTGRWKSQGRTAPHGCLSNHTDRGV